MYSSAGAREALRRHRRRGLRQKVGGAMPGKKWGKGAECVAQLGTTSRPKGLARACLAPGELYSMLKLVCARRGKPWPAGPGGAASRRGRPRSRRRSSQAPRACAGRRRAGRRRRAARPRGSAWTKRGSVAFFFHLHSQHIFPYEELAPKFAPV